MKKGRAICVKRANSKLRAQKFTPKSLSSCSPLKSSKPCRRSHSTTCQCQVLASRLNHQSQIPLTKICLQFMAIIATGAASQVIGPRTVLWAPQVEVEAPISASNVDNQVIGQIIVGRIGRAIEDGEVIGTEDRKQQIRNIILLKRCKY